MSAEDWVAYYTAIAAITSVIVQAIKILVIDGRVPDGIKRDTTVQATSYLINLGLILLVAWSKHLFAPEDALLYLGLAFGTAIGSNFGYQRLKASLPAWAQPTVPTPPIPPIGGQ